MEDFTKYLVPVNEEETQEDDTEDYTKYLTPVEEDGEDFTKYLQPTDDTEATPEGVRDLTQDKIFAKIAPYMKSRFGMTEDKFDRQKIVDAYVNNMRKFNFGQSVVTLGEMSYLKNASEVQKAEAAAAYTTFDAMKGAFAEGTSGMEKLDAVYDYGRALVVDPVNLISLGVGKVFTGGGAKAAAQIAKEAVKKEVADIIKKRGLTELAKQEAKQIERQLIGKVLKNEGFKDVAAGEFSKRLRGIATTEAIATGVTDTVAGVSIDAVYQQAMQEVGLQTEYDLIQGSVAAAGGVFGTGLSLGLNMLGRATGPEADMLGAYYFDLANQNLARARTIAGDVKKAAKEDLDIKGFQDSLPDFKKKMEEFATKVQQGSIIRMLAGGKVPQKETQIRKAFYLGDEALGIKGVAGILADNGVRNWSPRFDGDNFANWMHDLIIELPAAAQKDIDEAFRSSLGKSVDEYKGKSFTQALKMDAEQFSKAGQELNILSQMSRTLKYIPKADPDKMLEGVIEAELPAISQKVRDALGEGTHYLQRNLIRMLVTHPGTTALNLIGWQTASVMQSASDIVRGTLYGTGSLLNAAMFNKEGAAKYARKAGLMFSLQKQKARNLLDPHMTYEAFMDFAAYNPEAQKKMFKYLSGGIELEEIAKDLGFQDFGAMAKDMGIKEADALVQKRNVFDKIMDGAQTIYGVKAQDILTKSQEFMYAIDKQVRLEYGVSYVDFLKDENLWKRMTGDEYARIVSVASEDALRNVFAKQYGGTEGTLQFAAKVIEDVRKLPIIGAMIPFGQFFNNTLGHMMDHTGISLIHKYVAGTARDPMELLTKSAVGLTFIGAAATYEMDYLDEGLAWYQERSSDGTIRNRMYDFPYSFYKAVGRMAAHVYRDGEVPKPLIEELAATFGPQQLTRQLGDSIQGAYDMLVDITTSDDVEAKRMLGEFVSKSASMYLSGYSRPLDPVNQVIALSKGTPYVSPDRRQGSEWVNNSVRYVDEILGAMDLYTKPEQKQRPLTAEQDRVPIGRIFGIREELAQSPIQEMFNEAGLAQWRTGIRSNIAEPLNDINRMITPVLNYYASMYMDTNKWKNASAADRKTMISQIITLAKGDIKDMLAVSYDPADTRTKVLWELGKVPKKELAKILNDMGFESDPSKLDTEQLEIIKFYLDMEEKETKATDKLYGLK